MSPVLQRPFAGPRSVNSRTENATTIRDAFPNGSLKRLRQSFKPSGGSFLIQPTSMHCIV